MSNKKDNPPSSPKSPKPKQGEDYYFENGFLVMTEAYHKKRGYCCGSGCRHCPFEHANVD